MILCCIVLNSTVPRSTAQHYTGGNLPVAERKTITIHLGDGYPDLKGMIQDLRTTAGSSNRYYGRSESEIARMLLEGTLPAIHQEVCGLQATDEETDEHDTQKEHRSELAREDKDANHQEWFRSSAHLMDGST